MEEKRIIEVNGVKLEVDLSHCRVVENYHVGQNIKVLVKEYDSFKSYPGVIIGFDNFANRPSILIAYLDLRYSSAELKLVTFCADTKDLEICPANPKEIVFHKDRVIELLDKEITAAEQKVSDLKGKKQYFLTEFGAYFHTKEPVDA